MSVASCHWRSMWLQLARVATAANCNGLPTAEAIPYCSPYSQVLSGQVTLRLETFPRRALFDQAEASEGPRPRAGNYPNRDRPVPRIEPRRA
jgi:hypothetical protein